jgi:hypothetical protein
MRINEGWKGLKVFFGLKDGRTMDLYQKGMDRKGGCGFYVSPLDRRMLDLDQ